MLLYIVLNIEVVHVEVLSKKVKKLFEIHFNVINVFPNFMHDFHLEGRIPFGIRILRFLSDSNSTVPFAFRKDVSPLLFKWLKQYYMQDYIISKKKLRKYLVQ